MTDLTTFKQYLQLADQLTQVASKEELAECARLLALNLAHYELQYGSLPLHKTLAMTYADEPNEAQVEMLNKGMENLVGVLGGVIQGFEQKTSH
jgi:predicted metalloenzyme YecM